MGYSALYGEIIAHILLKQAKPQFSFTKTEPTRRSGCDAGALLGLKSALWAPSWLRIIQQAVGFLHISAPEAVLMGYIALYSEIIAHMLLKSWNH